MRPTCDLRSIALLLLAFALCVAAGLPGVAWAAQEAAPRTEQRERFREDGSVETRWQVRLTEDGRTLRHGSFQRLSPSGQVRFQAYYRDGEPAGIWQWFDAEGNLLKRERQALDYHDESVDTDTLRDGKTVIRTPGGVVIAEGQLKGDQPHGPWRYYYLSRVLKAEGSYLSGIQDGEWRYYHPNGQLAQRADYALGILHGRYLETWPSGGDKTEGRYDQGVRTGRWRTWADNGQLLSEGEYVEDREEGLWRTFREDGSPISRVLYAHGAPVRYFPVPRQRQALASGIDPAPLPPRLVTGDGKTIGGQ